MYGLPLLPLPDVVHEAVRPDGSVQLMRLGLFNKLQVASSVALTTDDAV